MPESPIVPRSDVQRLVDDGLTVIIEGQYIIIDKVPYVAAGPVLSWGAIISAYWACLGKVETNLSGFDVV